MPQWKDPIASTGGKQAFILLPVSDLLGPFLPRHQHRLIIADIELLAIIIPGVIRGGPEEGVAHIVVSGNANAISRTNKEARRRISLKLHETFQEWIIRCKLTVIVVYARPYHNASADALARLTVGKIEFRAYEIAFAWIELPELRDICALRVSPGGLYLAIPPFIAHFRSVRPVSVLGWDPVGYTVCTSSLKF